MGSSSAGAGPGGGSAAARTAVLKGSRMTAWRAFMVLVTTAGGTRGRRRLTYGIGPRGEGRSGPAPSRSLSALVEFATLETISPARPLRGLLSSCSVLKDGRHGVSVPEARRAGPAGRGPAVRR